MSIETRLYNHFYNGYEKTAEKVIEFRAEDNLNGVESIAKRYKRENRFFRFTEVGLVGLSLFSLGSLYNELSAKNSSDIVLHLSATTSAMALLLGVHFHYATNLSDKLAKRVLGKPIDEIDCKKIRRWETIGRYAHLSAVASLITAVAPPVYSFCQSSPVVGSAIAGIVSFCIYHNYIESYGALYSSMADFIVGERRHQVKTEGESK
jgi:hypothetical protein